MIKYLYAIRQVNSYHTSWSCPLVHLNADATAMATDFMYTADVTFWKPTDEHASSLGPFQPSDFQFEWSLQFDRRVWEAYSVTETGKVNWMKVIKFGSVNATLQTFLIVKSLVLNLMVPKQPLWKIHRERDCKSSMISMIWLAGSSFGCYNNFTLRKSGAQSLQLGIKSLLRSIKHAL